MIHDWLAEREQDAIWKSGYNSGETEFWSLLLDAHHWWWERVSPAAYWHYICNGETPPSWSELRKAGSSKYKFTREF